jgi:AcrR family transcriptional regulator
MTALSVPGPSSHRGADVLPLEGTRRRLTERQAGMVADLVRAAAAEAGEAGYDGVTVRAVARRAGVAPATAYQYFSSKDHLLAEVLWRHLQALPPVETDDRPLAERLEEAVGGIVDFAAESTARAEACTVALLGSSPDVRHLRDRIGAEIHRRIAAALGPEADGELVRVLETSYFGALLMAGMGHVAYLDIPSFMASAAERMVGRPVGRPVP